MTKTLMVMGLAVIAGVIGDLFLSRGMKDIGDASTLNLQTFLPFLKKVLACPKVWFGTGFLAIFFFLWLIVLSWEDLSVALPLTAATFVLGPLFAQIFLGESSTFLRWTGTVLISLGVFLVTLEEKKLDPNKLSGTSTRVETKSETKP